MGTAFADLLREFGVERTSIEAELQAMCTFVYARATDRSRLASMRDQMITAKHAVHRGRAHSPWEIMLALSYMPLASLEFRSSRSATFNALQSQRTALRGGA